MSLGRCRRSLERGGEERGVGRGASCPSGLPRLVPNPPTHTHTHSRTHVCNMTFMSPVQKPVSLSTLETAQELQGMGRELNFHQKHRK